MRNRFVDHLVKKIKANQAQDVFVLTGDLGFSVLEPLREVLGPRFINVGINEALLASTAAGISAEGFKVYIYSIMPFVTFRCLEQIRNDICYHNLDVTIVGIGAGYGYGALGPTHHSLEDLAAIWALPNIRVFSPADCIQSDWCFDEALSHKGPAYLRLGKGGEGEIVKPPQHIGSGVWQVSEGNDISIICTGHILEEAIKVGEALKKQQKTVQILSLAQVKPFPEKKLVESISSKNIVVLEELSPYGGFSGQVSKVLLSNSVPVESFKSFSTQDEFAKVVGSSKFQREQQKLDATNILSRI